MAALALIQIIQGESPALSIARQFEVKAWPVTIGRALTNDIVLTDPFAAPFHLRIEQSDAGYTVHALETNNGATLDTSVLKSGDQGLWSSNMPLTLGHTRLHLIDETASRAPEQRLLTVAERASKEKASQTAESPPLEWRNYVSSLIFLSLVLTGEGFLSNNPDVFVVNTLKMIGTVLGGLIVWSLAWGLVTKVFSGAVRFGEHFLIGAKTVTVANLVLWHLHAAAFAFSFEILGQFDSVIFVIMLGWLISRHLKIALRGGTHHTGAMSVANTRNAKLARNGAVAVTAAAIALMLGMRYNAAGRITDGIYMSTFMPPSWRLHTAKSPEVLDAGMAALKVKTDKQLASDGQDTDSDAEEY
jgi:pSer/pThr/pTyr-binding forkhead associated (FHA) protein